MASNRNPIELLTARNRPGCPWDLYLAELDQSDGDVRLEKQPSIFQAMRHFGLC
jgi:hypothetical protein